MEVTAAPKGFNYDARGLCFFEIYPDEKVNLLLSDKNSIKRQLDNSVYGAYIRTLNKKSTLYVSVLLGSNNITVWRVENLNDLADSLGFPKNDGHVHEIHACYSAKDDGKHTYAHIDVEFRCGCTLSSSNKRSISNYLKEKYGWEIVLDSINSEPLAKRTIRVKRKSLSETKLPF